MIYCSFILLSTIDNTSSDSRCSYGTDGNGFSLKWVDEWVSWATGAQVGDGSCGVGELVELSHEVSLEGVGLLVSDPSLVVLVEVVPCVLEVGLKVVWDLMWLKLMGGFEDGTGSELGLILHKELLSSLVAGWGLSLSGVLGENVVHNFILIGTVVSGDVHILPGGLINISSISVRVVGELDSGGNSKEESQYLSNLHIEYFCT